MERRITWTLTLIRVWHGWWKDRYVIYFIPASVKNSRRGWAREGNSLGIYSWEKNENRHERGTRWLCRWIGPLSRDEFNRKFCTGFPVSISFPRASTLPPSPASIVGPSKSESPIFSRFFRELENERFPFEFISTLFVLFVDGNRSLIFGDFGLVERFFFSFFIFYSSSFFLFEHVLSTLGAGKWRGDGDFECCAPQGFQFLIV